VTQAKLAHEVLRYCNSKPSEGGNVDLYVESDESQFAELARDWMSLDVVVRLIDRRANPARILKRRDNCRRLIWL